MTMRELVGGPLDGKRLEVEGDEFHHVPTDTRYSIGTDGKLHFLVESEMLGGPLDGKIQWISVRSNGFTVFLNEEPGTAHTYLWHGEMKEGRRLYEYDGHDQARIVKGEET